jgi:hypothetical protein
MKVLILIMVLMTQMMAWSQTETTTLDTVKEVFLKGSIDGDSMFMVLGTADGYKMSKDMMRDAINMDDLMEVGDDVKKLGKTISKFDEVIKKPWKSLKKIPKAYKVDLEKAQDAYYSADNQISGVLKYSGWAIWAQVEGAYYLVIEAPVVMASQVVAHGTTLAWKVAGLGLRVTWNLIKPAVGLIASTAVMTYATISSGIATTATLIAAGGVATFKGGKWLVVTLPSKLFKPVSAKIPTLYTFENQMELAKKIQELLTNPNDLFEDTITVESMLGKYKSEFKIQFEKNAMKAFELRTVIQNKKVELKLEASRAYFKEFRKEHEGMSHAEAKEKIQQEMDIILQKIIEQI